MVTHDNIMKALTANDIRYNRNKEKTIHSPFDLVGAKTFAHCEAFPYYLNQNIKNEYTYQPTSKE